MQKTQLTSNGSGGAASGVLSSNAIFGPVALPAAPAGVTSGGGGAISGVSNSMNSASSSGLESVKIKIPPPPPNLSVPSPSVLATLAEALLPGFAEGMEVTVRTG